MNLNHKQILRQALESAEKKGMSRRDVCNKSGVALRTLESWLYEGVNPNHGYLALVIDACGMKLVLKRK